LTLCFLSGKTGGYCSEFTLSYTSDPHPNLHSTWAPLKVERVTSLGPELEQAEEGLLRAGPANSMIGDAIFTIRAQSPPQTVTGFRVDVYPFWSADALAWQIGQSKDGDFCLTQFRVEAIEPNTTNLALGCPVRASHPLWANIPASVLTDGLPGSYAHPARTELGKSFFFEIDLGSVHRLDHLALRSRADGFAMDRMSKLLLALYDEKPESGGGPVWQAKDRADGSHPGAGEIDVIRAADGQGVCRGRYLRVSTESGVALSPQIAEVEAYGVLTPKLQTVKADGRTVPFGGVASIPAGADTLSFAMSISGEGAIEGLPVRWRLRGFHDDWQVTRSLIGEVSHLRPGHYVFEAQAGHTDGEWDASTATLALTVPVPWWRTPLFSWGLSGGILCTGALTLREVTRRRHAAKIAALEYSSALATERTRIARDMHDEVGARLSQLAVMQDVALHQHSLSPEAHESFRRVAETARMAAAALDEVVWAVNPRNDTLLSLVEYLGMCATNYLGPLEINCRLDSPLEWPSVEIRAQFRHQIALALKEALQNVVKHSGASEATLILRQVGGHLVIRVTDNGSGLPPEAHSSHRNGLHNMCERLASIGGSCEIRNLPEGGAEVEMRAPLPATPPMEYPPFEA
ncbi:MAG TPA: ATP-binding protein, partial [Chthoniobacteraceae bacterium]